jgi:hypothetical protein
LNFACARLFEEFEPEPEKVTSPGLALAYSTSCSSVSNSLSWDTKIASGV